MQGDQPIAESGETKVDAWVANEKRRLCGSNLVTRIDSRLACAGNPQSDPISSHLGSTNGN
jgi:hypothetical protein